MIAGQSRVFHIISRQILEKRTGWFRWGFAGLSFVVAVLLRWALDGQLGVGFPFVTFFPAVILTAFFCGLGPGSVVSVASFLASWLLFVSDPGTIDLSMQALMAMAFFAAIALTDIVLIHIMTRAVHRLDEERSHSALLADQRRLMFHELQHRVSNNLATVAGLLTIQRRAIKDETARKSLDDAATRINVVARMTRLLHDPSAQEVDFGTFLRDITHDMIAAAGAEGRVQVDLDCATVIIPHDRAIPLGLIASELLTNAIEHGFAGDASGRILLRLAEDGGIVTLRIEDDGHGLPPAFALEEARSLGLTIARQFAIQMDGSLIMENRAPKGAVSEIVFPNA